jgi:UDP-2,3-diacylglucosamine pyrophosphatase LpxH
LAPKHARYRSLFLSDTHLGVEESRPKLLNRFLKRNRAEYLYLVGDLVDLWKLRKGWYWPNEYNTLLRRLIKISRKRRVYYTPGNHDAVFKSLSGLNFGRIIIRNEVIHTTADGRRLLICHGDVFDDVMHNRTLFIRLGFDLLMLGSGLVNTARRLVGCRSYWSLSNFVAKRVANKRSYIDKFERMLAEYAAKRGVDGVVCGHIHLPQIRDFDGLGYYNCGDWVDHMTVLAEHFDGSLELLTVTEDLLADAPDPVVAASSRPADIPTAQPRPQPDRQPAGV